MWQRTLGTIGAAMIAGCDADGAGRGRRALPQHRQLRALARRLQAGGGVAGHLAPGDLGRARRRHLRPGHHPPRQRAGRVHAELPAVRRPHGRRRTLSERPAAVEGQRRPAVPHRAAVRRAACGGHRALGPGKRLRRLQGRHLPHHPLGRDAGLRLPAPGFLPQAADGRGAHRAARRPAAGRDDRQLGRRAWADAVHAVGLFQARRRFRRRRPRRHDPQRAGCAGLGRQSAEELRLAARPALAAGGARAGADAVAGGRPRDPASALAMGCAGASPRRTANCRPTICRPR